MTDNDKFGFEFNAKISTQINHVVTPYQKAELVPRDKI